MEPLRLSMCFVSLLVIARVIVGCGASTEEVFVGTRPEVQQHNHDPFSLLFRSFQGSGLEADLQLLPKGDSHVEKEPLCTVNCFRADPVCGGDGVTYWCGAAEAKCAQVEIVHEGYCDIYHGGTKANIGLHAAQSLQLVHMVWLGLAALLIMIGLP